MMSSQWRCEEKDQDAVRSALDKAIKKIHLPDFAKVHWEGQELCILIDQGGRSELRLRVQPGEGGTDAKETKRSIALLHRPFTRKVEEVIERVMHEAGFNRA